MDIFLALAALVIEIRIETSLCICNFAAAA